MADRNLQHKKKSYLDGVDKRVVRAHEKLLHSQSRRHEVLQKRRENSQSRTPAKPLKEQNAGALNRTPMRRGLKERPSERRDKLEKWRTERELKRRLQVQQLSRQKPAFKVTHIEVKDEQMLYQKGSTAAVQKLMKPVAPVAAKSATNASAKTFSLLPKFEPKSRMEPVKNRTGVNAATTKMVSSKQAEVKKTQEGPSVARRSARIAKQATSQVKTSVISGKERSSSSSDEAATHRNPRVRNQSNGANSKSIVQPNISLSHTSVSTSVTGTEPELDEQTAPATINVERGSSLPQSFAPDDFKFSAPNHLRPFPLNPMTPKSAVEFLFPASAASVDGPPTSDLARTPDLIHRSSLAPSVLPSSDSQPTHPPQESGVQTSTSEDVDNIKENVPTMACFMKTPIPLSASRSARNSRRSTARVLAKLQSPEERLEYLANSPMIEMNRRTPKRVQTPHVMSGTDTPLLSLTEAFDNLDDDDIDEELHKFDECVSDECTNAADTRDVMDTDALNLALPSSSEYESAMDESTVGMETALLDVSPPTGDMNSAAGSDDPEMMTSSAESATTAPQQIAAERSARRRSRRSTRKSVVTIKEFTPAKVPIPELRESVESQEIAPRRKSSARGKVALTGAVDGTATVPIQEGAPVSVEHAVTSTTTTSAEEHDWTYFRTLVANERTRMNTLCDRWETIFIGSGGFDEDVGGQIRTTIGQAHLLMAQRFGQFIGLVDDSEFNTGEKPIHASDLQGFWDMIYVQVVDIDSKFAQLEELRVKNWVVEVQEPLIKKAAVKKTKVLVKKPAVKSKFAEFRSKIHQQKDVADAVAVMQNEPEVLLVPSASGEIKSFEGGFFAIRSPVRDVKDSLKPASTTLHKSPAAAVSPLMRTVLEKSIRASPAIAATPATPAAHTSSVIVSGLHAMTSSTQQFTGTGSPAYSTVPTPMLTSTATPVLEALSIQGRLRRSTRKTPKTVKFDDEIDDASDFLKYLVPTSSVSESSDVSSGHEVMELDEIETVAPSDDPEDVDMAAVMKKSLTAEFDKHSKSAQRRKSSFRRSRVKAPSSTDDSGEREGAAVTPKLRRRRSVRFVQSGSRSSTTPSSDDEREAARPLPTTPYNHNSVVPMVRRRSTRRYYVDDAATLDLAITQTPQLDQRRVSLPFTPPVSETRTNLRSSDHCPVVVDLMNFSPAPDLMCFSPALSSSAPDRKRRRTVYTPRPGASRRASQSRL